MNYRWSTVSHLSLTAIGKRHTTTWQTPVLILSGRVFSVLSDEFVLLLSARGCVMLTCHALKGVHRCPYLRSTPIVLLAPAAVQVVSVLAFFPTYLATPR